MRKKSMKSWAKVALISGACLFVANGVFAASIVLDTNNSSWGDPTSWAGDVLPGANDQAIIRNQHTVTVDSVVGAVSNFFIGDTSTYQQTGTVNIVTGGKLISLNGSGTVRSAVGRAVNGAVGYLNLSGGTLQMGAASGTNVLHVGVDTAGVSTRGIFTISGGTFDGRLLVGSAIAGDSGDKVRIVGDNALSIGTASLIGNALEVRASGSLEFIFDATGISTMNYGTSGAGGTATFATGSQIIIDGAAYTGGANTFTLIQAGVLSAVTQPTISLINFAEGTTYDYNTTTDTLTVTTVVPEPATIGMIGVGALVAMLVRRQMRR